MRKQYHSRLTSRGRLIWDVHHLVALSAGLPKSRVALSAIRELDEPFWFDGDGDVATCRAIDGRVMDGMHRVAKAHMLGHRDIEAVRFNVDPEPDYVAVPCDDQ